jgi:hypothetical protein
MLTSFEGRGQFSQHHPAAPSGQRHGPVWADAAYRVKAEIDAIRAAATGNHAPGCEARHWTGARQAAAHGGRLVEIPRPKSGDSHVVPRPHRVPA